MKYYLGVDVGSVSTNLVLMDKKYRVIKKIYLKTRGQPIKAIKKGLDFLGEDLGDEDIAGVGTTGSGRMLAAALLGADIIKNEITAHAIAGIKFKPEVSTIIEIGGQDSKIIILRKGIVVDFAMNTICAAGTGSFLDRQAERLGIPIEEFGSLALKSRNPVRIAGRCAVFAESDMIHKQQIGHNIEDIIKGLCEALVRNYLNNVAKGKEIKDPILFQGGVAANIGIKKAFEKALNRKISVPDNYDVMGAYGAAILAKEKMEQQKIKTNFRGFPSKNTSFNTSGFECTGCSNHCEIIEIKSNGRLISRWGDRCGKWNDWQNLDVI